MSTNSKVGLVIDTGVSHDQGSRSQQLRGRYPQRPGLTFVSLEDVKSLANARKTASAGLQSQDHLQDATRIRRGPRRSVREDTQSSAGVQKAERPRSNAAALAQATPQPEQREDFMPTAPLHSRVRGLRPSPLDLSTDVSPSDRAIPIGISFATTPLPYQLSDSTPRANANAHPYNQSPLRAVHEAVTPTIIVTPAKETFPLTESPVDLGTSRPRPTSSVYSRPQTSVSKTINKDQEAEMPPLPVDAAQMIQRNSPPTGANASAKKSGSSRRAKKEGKPKGLSVHTAFDETTPQATDAASAKRLTSQSLLPTPRRSRGWWSVITSPFSFTPKRGTFASRSLSLQDDDDGESLLLNAQRIGMVGPHAGLILSDRAEDDDSIRSAPPQYSDIAGLSEDVLQLKRSDTAPGALDLGSDRVNIYQIPSNGEAASYYDIVRNFPGLIGPVSSRGIDDLDGWSPSHSVFREPRNLSDHPIGNLASSEESLIEDEPQLMPEDSENLNSVNNAPDLFRSIPNEPQDESTGAAVANVSNDAGNLFKALPAEPGDYSEADFAGFSATHPAAERGFFSSPTATELHMPDAPETPVRNETLQSHFSPCSPTPVLENARVATFLGPQSANGEGREIDMASTRSPSPRGLGAATMASRDVGHQPAPFPAYEFPDEDTAELDQEPLSTGLGISDEEKRSLPSPPPLPPTPLLDEKTRLGTDRFGQLRLETDPYDAYRQPWYRRFSWFLVANAVALLLLLVVLLVMFIPRHTGSEPVKAEWLNLTAFPAVPTGIMTVIQPAKVEDVSGCISPAALWSCAMPAGEQGVSAAPLPNFRIEISFRNQTESGLNSTDLEPTVRRRSTGMVAQASALLRRSAWSSYLFSPSPAPPSTNDQIFLGRTTDNNSYPYDGEETPFFISLLNASALETTQASSSLSRRSDEEWHWPLPSHSANSARASGSSASLATAAASSSRTTPSVSSTSATPSSETSNSPSSSSVPPGTSIARASAATGSSSSTAQANTAPTSAPSSIPPPALKPNGQAASADLYPFATAQPLRLYNRGLENEYYGFYTYFSRSLYISSDLASTSASSSSSGINPSSQPISSNNSTAATAVSNVALSSAAAVCTWTQSRLLVQIWTRKPPPNTNGNNQILRPVASNSPNESSILSGSASSTSSSSQNTTPPASNSTANDMTSPGSFPYAITVTIDRHGGEADEKGVFCYGIDDGGSGKVDVDAKSWVFEDRGFGGTLVHPAQVPGASPGGGLQRRDSAGEASDQGEGIDGGTGGCSCAWQNWT